jgi:hypothetical protein
MPVWWAFCDAVRSRVFHLLSDRMTMEGWFPLGCDGSRLECPRTEQLEQSLGKAKSQAAPTLWLIALVSLTTGVLWSWHLGTSKSGERRYLIDLLQTLPQAVLKSVLLVCDAGYVGYDLFDHLLRQECSFLIRLSRVTRRVVNQNLVFGVLVIVVGIILSAKQWLTPVPAVILHLLSSLVIVFNSARLVRFGEELSEAAPEEAPPAPRESSPKATAAEAVTA